MTKEPPIRPPDGSFKAPDPAEFILEVPTDLQVIETTVAELVTRCEQFDFGGSRLSLNFRVAVTEALANAMLYGNGRDPAKNVRVEGVVDCTRIVLWVRDEGRGFDPDAVPDPTLPANLERPGGRGLFLIRELMDEVEYNERGNAVRLVLHREKAPPRPPGA